MVVRVAHRSQEHKVLLVASLQTNVLDVQGAEKDNDAVGRIVRVLHSRDDDRAVILCRTQRETRRVDDMKRR